MNESLPRERSEYCEYEQRSLAFFQAQPEGPVTIFQEACHADYHKQMFTILTRYPDTGSHQARRP